MLFCDSSLITMHISDCCQFSDIHISQGSVATYLRCGGIFKYEFVANLPVTLSVKKFWKSVNIWGSYGQEFSVLFFWDTVYFSFQLQWEQCCVKQLHFVVRPADWLLPSTAAHMLRWVWDPWSKTSSDIKLSLSESIGSASKEPSHMREKKINASRFEKIAQKRRKIRRNIKKQPVRGDIQAGWWSNEDGRWHGMENCRRLLEALDCVLIRR